MNSVDLILASSSPRRQAFLRALQLSFRIVTAELDETPEPGETPTALVARLALAKADAVADRVRRSETRPAASARTVIVAADTTVARGQEILGKPENAAEATAMLQGLRGLPHFVHSAVAVRTLDEDSALLRVNSTVVTMRHYTDDEIREYVATGDPLDKAGGYALQHPKFAPAACLTGCLAGVVGLPLLDLTVLLGAHGIVVGEQLAPICEAQAAFSCCARG